MACQTSVMLRESSLITGGSRDRFGEVLPGALSILPIGHGHRLGGDSPLLLPVLCLHPSARTAALQPHQFLSLLFQSAEQIFVTLPQDVQMLQGGHVYYFYNF